jgi:acyl carrier protein
MSERHPDEHEILDLIFAVLAEAPKREGAATAVDADTPLIGEDALLDSLGLVALITGLEQRLDDEYGVIIAIAIDEAIGEDDGPLRTPGTLVKYVRSLIDATTSAPE